LPRTNLLDPITLLVALGVSLSLIISTVRQASSDGTFFEMAKDELRIPRRIAMDVIGPVRSEVEAWKAETSVSTE
jgi:hypothetical protein